MSQTYHFIGIGGIGMSGLAQLLLSKNLQVSGSDIAFNYTIDNLIKAGAVIHKGHSGDLINEKMTVVYGTDIKQDNPEYVAAIKHQCKMLHRADLLADLTENYRSFAVAGTHGKTTTSALLATVLVEAGVDPSFAVGGMMPEFHGNSRLGQGDIFAFEADESDRTFLKYHPLGAIVTNIDNDHLISYDGKESNLIDAFKQFMDQVKSTKHLFWCAEDAHLKQLNRPGKKYGFSEDCDWKVSTITQNGFTLQFDILGDGKLYSKVQLACMGSYNALNACAVFGLAITLGIDEQSIRNAFKNFKGVMRRCENKGEINSVLFLDDYAHHPTEIRVTLKALREAINERRLIAVFQPHRFTRTEDCLGMYGSIFEVVDELIVTDIFAAGESPLPNVTSDRIIEEIKSMSSVPVQYVPRTAINHKLAQMIQPHDVVVTLGAGDITKVASETISLIEKQLPRLKVGLVFGGPYTEHEVSIRSSEHFRQSLNPNIYSVENFGITKTGGWIYGNDAKQKLESIKDNKKESMPSNISPQVIEKLLEMDLFIPVLHGPLGEDGMIQGFFEILKKPYVGCDHRSAAVSMDKVISKKLAEYHDIKTASFIDFSKSQWQETREAILESIMDRLVFPLFVKPTHLGSSVGVKKVSHKNDLEKAIEDAFYFDTHVLVENGIVGREIEFAALGNDRVIIYPPGEILTNGAVYDYEGKYSDQSIQTTPKADLSAAVIDEGIRIAKTVYSILGCTGLARIDFFLDANNHYWFNEINPIPGFTSLSLYPQMCAQNGLEATNLMDQLIILALEKKRRQDRLTSNQELALQKKRVNNAKE